jgi:mRNA-degrading endonuclease RelE of RelBE toxin-antitoxin system
MLSEVADRHRIIYQVIGSDRTVRVAAIRHRSAAYGNDPR